MTFSVNGDRPQHQTRSNVLAFHEKYEDLDGPVTLQVSGVAAILSSEDAIRLGLFLIGGHKMVDNQDMLDVFLHKRKSEVD